MEGYLGETIVPIEQSPFDGNTPQDWALYLIEGYGQIDGAHHKDWVLDQVARVLHGTPMIIKRAEWAPNERYPEGLVEWRIDTGEPTRAYHDWVVELKDGEDGPETYGYEVGIAP